MITKMVREKAIVDNKAIILEFIERNWDCLATDKAICEKEDYVAESDVRRIVKDFIYTTPQGSLQVAFEFKIHTKSF